VYLNDFATLFGNTITEFDILVKKNIDIEPGIILEKEVSKTINCGNNLKNVIQAIPNREKRTLAFAYLTRYPIQHCFNSDDIEDQLLEEDYKLEEVDATNLAIAKHNNFFLFTVAVDNSLKNNTLQINGKSQKQTIDNLFGENQNTQYIESQILKINAASLDLFEQLKIELKNSVSTLTFEKAYKSANSDVQQSIIDCFIEAPKRGLASPYFPDNKQGGLIKDVTPDHNTKKSKVYELRVYTPVALRVYFYELNDKIYLSSIGYKNEYKKKNSAQSKDISRALINIDQLIKTNK
jgi:hypothetical protein